MARPHYVYVISLKKEVLQEKRFREENPDYVEGKPCVYVGSSSRTPEERLQQHMSGAVSKKGVRLSNKYVKRYGDGLRPRQYEKYNPVETVEESRDIEKKLAEKLRKKGYAVWQR